MSNLNVCSSSSSIDKTLDYSYKEIEELKNKVNSIYSSHHNVILKMICDHEIMFSENQNGCFINLLNVPSHLLSKIEKYVDFIIEKEESLKEFEQYKESVHENTI